MHAWGTYASAIIEIEYFRKITEFLLNRWFRCPTNGCTIIHKFPADKGKRSVTCAGCKCQINLQMQIATKTAAEDLYCQAAQMMADRKPREAAIAFITGINLFYTAAVPPHRSTHIAQESLRTCLTAIGRVWFDANYGLAYWTHQQPHIWLDERGTQCRIYLVERIVPFAFLRSECINNIIINYWNF